MCWLKRGIWKAGITIAGMLLLLVLMIWLPMSAAGAYERASGLAGPGKVTVQATPTEDATVTALNKEKLVQEVQQLKNQNALDLFGWLRTNAAILLSTLVVVIGGLIGLFRWFGDRHSEREKRAEERFQAVVEGLSGEKEEAKIGAAITLRTFLRPGYEQFYTQTCDLAIAHLCPTRTSNLPADPNAPMPLTILRQALIVVFKEAFPRARERIKKRRTLESSFLQRIKALLQLKLREEWPGLQSLDASYIQLDNAYLVKADLKQVWMQEASLRKANLSDADLREADLTRAHLREANLRGADLTKTNLCEADLTGAHLNGAHLIKANLREADLSTAHLTAADLRGADLRGAHLCGADFNQADLSEADLTSADLHGANLSVTNLTKADLSKADLTSADLHWTKLENVLSLANANLRLVKGPTKEQLEACKVQDAIIDEDTTTSASQSTVSPLPPSQSNDVQAPPAPSAQGNTPTPDRSGSGAASSKLGLES